MAPRSEQINPSHRIALILAVTTAALIGPWCGYLALTLPDRVTAEHWSLAWAGLDAAEGICAALTAILIHRRRPHAGLTATLGAGLLITDAWFDICTAANNFDRTQAIAAAVGIELPLAFLALGFAWTSLTGLVQAQAAPKAAVSMSAVSRSTGAQRRQSAAAI